MNKAEIEKRSQNINKLIVNNQIIEAMDLLNEMVTLTKMGDFRRQFDKAKETYANILKYTMEGVNDPEREKIFTHLQISLLQMADLAKENILVLGGSMHTYLLKSKLDRQNKPSKNDSVETIDNLIFNRELDDILRDSSLEKPKNTGVPEDDHKEALIQVFNRIWLTDIFAEGDIVLVKSACKLIELPWYEKSLIVSALTMSLLRCFDENKIELLFDFYDEYEDQVWQRALIGLMLGLYIYDERLFLYKNIIKRIKKIAGDPRIEKDIHLIIIQLIKSKETEKLTKKFHDEIIPEVIKLKPKIEDKLDLNNILKDDFSDDKNPDWETFFEDTPEVFEKLQEFSELQMEGSDVFMSAFSMLKHFDFFNELSNWLLPFYKENEIVKNSLKGEKSKIDTDMFAESLSKSAFMCNSDKYSFCLNVKQMPEMQKNMMMDLFNAEMQGMNEISKEDNIIDKSTGDKRVIAQYVQDLYRFYKLYNFKNEFSDIFSMKLDFHNKKFFRAIIKDKEIFRNNAELYFNKDYYEEALEIYEYLKDQGDISYEIFEKIAYCNQRLKNYDEALNYYKQAEIFGTNSAWILKKIALCYRIQNRSEEALKYYLEAEKLQPDNLFVQATIGHCYLDLGDFEKALKYYFKVEFLAPDNVKVMRPISWCLFVVGKFQDAEKYYKKLFKTEPNHYDYMNYGHVLWCKGKRKEAVEYYQKSLAQENNSMQSFMTGFEEDKKHLIKHGVDESEIPLVIDYLRYCQEINEEKKNA